MFRIREDRNTIVVLFCGAEEPFTMNVDFLNCALRGAVWLGDGFDEWVEVAHNNGDLGYVLHLELFSFQGNVACENSYLSFWVE